MNYGQAIEVISDLISDCASHDWDLHDDENWESMVTQLERLKDYVILEHLRGPV